MVEEKFNFAEFKAQELESGVPGGFPVGNGPVDEGLNDVLDEFHPDNRIDNPEVIED
ncbi:MAG: hypothetical protein PF542_05415 [Nanoarchaeota archaeon]|jgi:hypothetical protein|nr:hypothetical protein [Nanoarchaeota archaeon]